MNIAFRSSPPTAPDDAEPLGSGSVARIEIFDELPAGEAAWRKLVTLGAVASPYQNYDWVRLWHRHVSPHAGMAPCLIAGFGASDEPMFLWPFVRWQFAAAKLLDCMKGGSCYAARDALDSRHPRTPVISRVSRTHALVSSSHN